MLHESNLTQGNETPSYRDLLWTAPELLRMERRPAKGTQKGDVYSFAIILQQIAYGAAPYFYDSGDARGFTTLLTI